MGDQMNTAHRPGVRTSEERLLLAVVLQACVDAGLCGSATPRRPTSHIRQEARAWLRGRDCRGFCELLDLDHTKIVQALQADEARTWDERRLVQTELFGSLFEALS